MMRRLWVRTLPPQQNNNAFITLRFADSGFSYSLQLTFGTLTNNQYINRWNANYSATSMRNKWSHVELDKKSNSFSVLVDGVEAFKELNIGDMNYFRNEEVLLVRLGTSINTAFPIYYNDIKFEEYR